MKKNRLGTSDLHVSEIGFGCMSLGLNQKENERILQCAIDLGINFFDTADLYDQGQNEIIVGKALKPYREKIILATKVGNRLNENAEGWHWDASKAYIKGAVHKSLKRLDTDYIDLYQLHGGTIEDPIDETIEAFEDLKEEGLIRYYGISSIRPNVIREYIKRSNIVSVMMQYSLLDRRPEEAMLELLHQNNISVIVRGPVAKGLLAGKPSQDYLEHSSQEVQDLQAKLQSFVNDKRSMGQLALRYTLAHPAVATVIPGASRLEQLEDNVAAANTHLQYDEYQQLKNLNKAYTYQAHR